MLRRNRDPKLGIKVAFGFVMAVLFIFPIVWMLFVSIKPDGYVTTQPLKWFLPPYTFSNYTTLLFDSLILRWLVNSLIVAAMTTILTLIVTSLAAYAISQMKFRYKNFILVSFC